jgi:phosphoglycerate dehydrogenase-like enzyme
MLPGKERRRETNVRFGILGTGVVGKTIAARLDAMGHGDAAAHVVAAV